MFINLYNNKLSDKQLDVLCSMLQQDEVLILPTDTLYAFVCSISSHKAAKHLAMLKHKTLEKSNFSILCRDLSQASMYVKPLSKNQFSFIKDLETGGFTFVLPASNLTPKIFLSKKRTIGIRISQHPVIMDIIDRLGEPLLVSSVPHDQDTEEDYYLNAELIYELYSKQVAAVVGCQEEDLSQPSTVVDMLDSDDFQVIRQGLGEL